MSQDVAGVDPGIFGEIRKAPPTEAEREEVERVLRSYFSGNRGALRTSTFLDLRVAGRRGEYAAMAVDVSRSGIQLRIVDPGFAGEDGEALLMPYTARVWRDFRGGLVVRFPDGETTAVADVVRVTSYCGRGPYLILIGCRFRHELSREDCERIGVAFCDDLPPGETA